MNRAAIIAFLLAKLSLCFVEFSEQIEDPTVFADKGQLDTLELPHEIPQQIDPRQVEHARPLLPYLGETRLGQELRVALLFPDLHRVRVDHGESLGVTIYAAETVDGDLSAERAQQIQNEMNPWRPPGYGMRVTALRDAPQRSVPVLSPTDALIVALHSPGNLTPVLLQKIFPHLKFTIHGDQERLRDDDGTSYSPFSLEISGGEPSASDRERLNRLGSEIWTPGHRWMGLRNT